MMLLCYTQSAALQAGMNCASADVAGSPVLLSNLFEEGFQEAETPDSDLPSNSVHLSPVMQTVRPCAEGDLLWTRGT